MTNGTEEKRGRGHADREREFEIGMDEAWKANLKRTYDEYQDIALTAARRSQSDYNADTEQRRNHGEQLHNVSLQALQNAVETANMVGKQAVRHSDLAIDRQWNVDEVAKLVSENAVSIAAIAAAIAKAVQEDRTTR